MTSPGTREQRPEWWVGLAMVGLLVVFYLIAAYAPWLWFFGGG